MPIGPDTNRQGNGRTDRNHDWQNAGGVEWTDTGTPENPEYRHQGDGYEYLVRHDPESSRHPDTDWVASIFDDTGQYHPVSGHLGSLADAQLTAIAYHDNEWRPGSDYEIESED